MVSVERFWGAYARWYDTIWDGPVTGDIRDEIRSRLGSPRRVVDLGCGTGLLSDGLAGEGIHVVGVDTSTDMLDRALHTRRISKAIHAPAECTGLASGIADAVIIANLLHLHANPNAVITEARRIASPRAPIVVAWPAPQLSPLTMFLADRRAGRSLAASLRADILRRRIGLLASRAHGPVADRARGADTHELAGLLDTGGLIVAACAVVGTIDAHTREANTLQRP